MISRKVLTAVPLLALSMGNCPVHAQDAAAFYRGRNVSLVVGFNPGGGADAYGRLVARHLSRHIPGNPNVVVRNMQGAGSVIAANHIFNVSPKDGSEIGLFAGNIVVDPLIGGTQAKYDARAFNWVGSPSAESHVCLSSAKSAIKSFDDVFKREMVTGTSGTSTLDIPLTLNAVVGTKLKLVKGYGGSAALRLAMERGEIDGFCGVGHTFLSVTGLISPERANVLVQIGLQKNPLMPKVPFILDYLKSDADRQLFTLMFGWLDLERPIAAPPGTPTNRVQALRNAFDLAMQDPVLLAEAKKQNIGITPMGGAAIAKFVSEVSKFPDAVTGRAARILGRSK